MLHPKSFSTPLLYHIYTKKARPNVARFIEFVVEFLFKLRLDRQKESSLPHPYWKDSVYIPGKYAMIVGKGER